MKIRLSLALVCSLVVPHLRAQPFDIISRPQAPPGTEIVKIDRPNPTQRLTEYPSIPIRIGDVVTVHGEGCVQTGGAGKTWKRYVNPSGPNTDRLYHGLVWIPGATSSLVRVESVQDKPLTVAGTPGTQTFLRLGYEDDNYGDNSYNGHDDGTEDQCRGPGGGAAAVTVTIRRAPEPGPKPAPFDLVATEFDINGLMLNPKWGEQVNSGNRPGTGLCGRPWLPPCTTQSPSIDKDGICAGFGLLGGHANWAPVTYEGIVEWESHTAPGQDDDYSLNLHTPGNAGTTFDRPNEVHIEFNSDETIDHFQTPWWKRFREAVDKYDDSPINRPLGSGLPHEEMVNGKFAIVTGLMGLDLSHDPGAESHPVWAMAIRAQDDPSDEQWAMFVRNWGDEGYCSDDQHFVDFVQNRYTFKLPWRAGAESVRVIDDKTVFLTNNSGSNQFEVAVAQDEGVFVTFRLPRPEDGGRINGEIHLQWTGASPSPSPRPSPRVVGDITDEVEDYFGSVVGKLTPQQRAAFLAALPPKNTTMDAIPVRAAAGKRRPPTRPKQQSVVVRAVADTAKINLDKKKRDVLRSIAGDAATPVPPKK